MQGAGVNSLVRELDPTCQRIDLYNHKKYIYFVNGKKFESIEGQLALDLRDGKIKELRMEVVNE